MRGVACALLTGRFAQIGLAWFLGAKFGLISDDVRKGEFVSRFGGPAAPGGKIGSLKEEL